jgi:hypothetical protein
MQIVLLIKPLVYSVWLGHILFERDINSRQCMDVERDVLKIQGSK